MSTNQPTSNIELVPAATRVGFMGPHGTFTEQALLSQPDLASADTRPFDSIPDVLNGLVTGEVDLGFVPIENAIEGAVKVTQDALAANLEFQSRSVLQHFPPRNSVANSDLP